MKPTTEEIYKRIVKKMMKIENSKDIHNNTEKVRLDKNNYFSIEGKRDYDEDSTWFGKIMFYEIYLVRKGNDYDCCTCYGVANDDRDYGLRDFIGMYV